MFYYKKEERMRKKQLLLITATLLCALILSSSPAFAISGQQVKIPYVVSMDDVGWWTGIAITNNSGSSITDMKLAFTKDNGSNGWYMPPFLIAPPPIRALCNSWAIHALRNRS